MFELSSYQTADMAFSPDIAGGDQPYPEHTDWHRDIERYFADKLNLIDRDNRFPGRPRRRGQDTTSSCSPRCVIARILPDPRPSSTTAFASVVRSQASRATHNLDNARLAAQIALAAGGGLEGIVKGISAFRPLPHRLEEHTIGGLTFVDDSISTTPEATKAALAAYPGKRIALIAGGHERKQDYAELATLLATAWRHRAGRLARHRRPPCHRDLRRRAADRSCRSGFARGRPQSAGAASRKIRHHHSVTGRPQLRPARKARRRLQEFEERGRAFVRITSELFG